MAYLLTLFLKCFSDILSGSKSGIYSGIIADVFLVFFLLVQASAHCIAASARGEVWRCPLRSGNYLRRRRRRKKEEEEARDSSDKI